MNNFVTTLMAITTEWLLCKSKMIDRYRLAFFSESYSYIHRVFNKLPKMEFIIRSLATV
jgi:hypothetical protein